MIDFLDHAFAISNPLVAFVAGLVAVAVMWRRRGRFTLLEAATGWMIAVVMLWIGVWLAVQVLSPTVLGRQIVPPEVGAVALRPAFLILYLFVAFVFVGSDGRPSAKQIRKVAEDAAKKAIEEG